MSQPASLPPDLRARVLGAARAERVPDRVQAKSGVIRTLALGAVLTVAVFFLIGGLTISRRPLGFVALTLLGWGAIAALATWGGAARGRSMLGRPTGWLFAIALLTVPSLLAWMVIGTSIWPETRRSPPADLSLHVGCFIATTLLALGPFVALVAVRRRTDPVHPAATGAAIGASAGAWGGVMIDLHCAVSATLHVAVAHLAPILVFAVVGGWLCRRWIGISSVRS